MSKKEERDLLRIVEKSCQIKGKTVYGWRDVGIKTQGAIDGLVNYYGYKRNTVF